MHPDCSFSSKNFYNTKRLPLLLSRSVLRYSYNQYKSYQDGKTAPPSSLRFVGTRHASLITASDKPYLDDWILLSSLQSLSNAYLLYCRAVSGHSSHRDYQLNPQDNGQTTDNWFRKICNICYKMLTFIRYLKKRKLIHL